MALKEEVDLKYAENAKEVEEQHKDYVVYAVEKLNQAILHVKYA